MKENQMEKLTRLYSNIEHLESCLNQQDMDGVVKYLGVITDGQNGNLSVATKIILDAPRKSPYEMEAVAMLARGLVIQCHRLFREIADDEF